MSYKRTILATVQAFTRKPINVKINNKIEFDILPKEVLNGKGGSTFDICKKNGNFEIQKIPNVSYDLEHDYKNPEPYYEDFKVLLKQKEVYFNVFKSPEGLAEINASFYQNVKTIDSKNLQKHDCPDSEEDVDVSMTATVTSAALKEDDVILIADKEEEIPCKHSVLTGNSKILEKLFTDSFQIPVKIKMDRFDADTIKASLDYCNGDKNAIVGKEMKVLKYANKYKIEALKEACFDSLEANVNAENVCEIIEFAYKANHEKMKQKCFKVIAENKNKIDGAKLNALPQNILVDALRY